MKTNQEKSKVIAGKLGIEKDSTHLMLVSDYEGTMGCDDLRITEWSCDCGFKGDTIRSEIHRDIHCYPDFFTPEGQAVLAKALLENKNLELAWKIIYREKHMSILTFIAVTGKLAQLVYEFIEGEKDA